jgi:protein-tyrosine-phosphatase
MTEALLIAKGLPKESIVSAGTRLSGPEQELIDLMPHTNEVIEVIKEIGIDISHAIRKQVTEDMVNRADIVLLTVDDTDPVPEYITESPKTIRWHVLDPKGKDLDFTRSVRNQLSKYIDDFLIEKNLL